MGDPDSVQSKSQEDLLEKGMVTHSSILAWKIPWTKEPGGLQSMGSQRVKDNWKTSITFLLRNLYAVKQQQLKPAIVHLTVSKFGKEFNKDVYC